MEDLFKLQPEVIITSPGNAMALRALPGSAQVTALSTSNGVIEVADPLLGNPGLGMLDAAEAVFRAVYQP